MVGLIEERVAGCSNKVTTNDCLFLNRLVADVSYIVNILKCGIMVNIVLCIVSGIVVLRHVEINCEDNYVMA